MVRLETSNEYEQIEASVDWLASDIDQSEVESVWTIPTDEAEDIDYFYFKIQKCSNPVFCPIKQLQGTWELDFASDGIHKRGSKKKVSIEEALIHRRRCLFCHKHKYFFSRGSCDAHSWKILGRNLQAPCIGLEECPVYKEDNFSQRSLSNNRARYTCSCFLAEGGHFIERKGRGNKKIKCFDQHKNESSKFLELIGRWIQSMATFPNDDIKNVLLKELSKTLITFFEKKLKIEK
ncbi:12399_t:CDS:2 [Ambispora gerdemannii]|uniref:12399_t:CDS:1 n=1 Tax=Ambispora gerdemannii TaxID=144530 RepID=A0A9N9GC92_9GLOM|nr:12399_t:CDS:2 [Ambispora gerdemannii]